MRWPKVRGRYLFREVNERGYDLPLASVTRHGGVEFRSTLNIEVWNPGSNTSHYKRTKPGDFVIGLRSFQSGIGYSTLEGLVSPAYTVLRPVSQVVYGPFFKHLFKSDIYISRLENVAQGIRQGRTISTEDFYNIPVAVPTIAEQRAIADYLDVETGRIDSLVFKEERMLKLLDEYDQGILDDYFEHISKDGFARLGFFAEVRSGVTLSGKRPTTRDDVTVPYLRVANVQHGRLDLSEVKAVTVDRATALRTALRRGDVLMTEGGDIDKLGRGTVWRGEINPCLHQNHVFAVRARTGELLPSFLALVTRTSYARRYFEKTGVRSTNLASTNSSKVASFKIPVPDLDTQIELVQSYGKRSLALQGMRTAIGRSVELLDERRRGLITAAVTGRQCYPGSGSLNSASEAAGGAG